MAPGEATPAGGCRLELERDIPFPERGAHLPDQVIAGRCVGFVAETACPPFPFIGHMHVMEVALAVPELCVDGRRWEGQEVLVMTAEAEGVLLFVLIIGSVELVRISSLQELQVQGTVRVMAGGAFPLSDGPMERFFPFQSRRDLDVTAEAEVPFHRRQEPLGI